MLDSSDRRALAASRKLMRSPLYSEKKPLPQGTAQFTYERSLWANPLEDQQSIVFRNLEAARLAVLLVLADQLGRPFRLRLWQPSAELLELLRWAEIEWSQAFRLETFTSSLHSLRWQVYWSTESLEDAAAIMVVEGVDWPAQLENAQLVAQLLPLPQGLARLSWRGQASDELGPLESAIELSRRVRSVIGGSLSFTQLYRALLPTGQRPRPLAPPAQWSPAPVYEGNEKVWLSRLREWRQASLRQADESQPPTLEELEQRLLSYQEPPPGWVARPLLFNSCMAALSALALLMPRSISRAAYFETAFLRQFFPTPGAVEWVESVAYDWEMQPWDGRVSPGTEVLVCDTTLSAAPMAIPGGLQAAIRVWSGLKFDQFGQELENVGAMLIMAPPELADSLAFHLSRLRAAMGVQPCLPRLAPDWVFSAQDGHAEAVFGNNAWLAQHLPGGGLLERLVYPGRAPFCVLHCQHPEWVAAAIEGQARKRQIPLARGASFGFVAHRHEAVVPVLKEGRILYKVAMGSLPGNSRQAVLELLQEVLEVPDLSGLRRRFPFLRPLAVARDWATPSPRLQRYLELG